MGRYRNRKSTPAEVRFMRHVIKQESGCWDWQAFRCKKGYGRFHRVIGVAELAHRSAWIIFREEIPDGMFLLHKCDRPNCVNPDHLFVGSASDNTNDMVQKWRTRSKLTKEQVDQIRVAPGKYRDIAAQFGLKSHKSVSNIKKGLTFNVGAGT